MATVLITGGAKRIGKAIALHLASQGYDIALQYSKSGTEAQSTCFEIKKMGRECHLFSADFSKKEAAAVLLNAVFKTVPDLEFLVNNASIFERGLFMETQEELLYQQFQVNFFAPFLLTQGFARKMQGHGAIVNILDTKISRDSSPYFAYLLSKKALADFTKMAAAELAPRVRVNGIAPGTTLPSPYNDWQYVEDKGKKMPMQEAPKPENIAKAVQFLLEADYLTGDTLHLDAGEHLTF